MTRKMIFLMGMVVLLGIPFSAKAQQAFKPVTLEAKKSVTIQAEDYNKGGKGVGYQARQMKYKNPTGDKFPILAWHGPHSPNDNTQRWIEMANAGFNLAFSIMRAWGYTTTRTDNLLNNAHGTGVEQMMDVNLLFTKAAYKNHGDVSLWWLVDEPSISGLEQVLEKKNQTRSNDESRLMYYNLYPTYATGGTGVAQNNYEEGYVRPFAEKVGTGFLSWDHYPLEINPTTNQITLRNDFFKNLQISSKIGRETNQPLWAFVCSSEHLNYLVKDRTGTADVWWPMRFEMWSNLAYGAQCIQYFTYGRPQAADFRWCPLSNYGGEWRLEDIYYGVADLNRQLEILTPVFLNAKVVNVGHIGKSKPTGTATFTKMPECVNHFEAATGEPGFLVSHLKNGDDEYLMVVNHSISDTPQNCWVSWKSLPYTVTRIYAGSSALQREAVVNHYVVQRGDYLLFHWNINN